MDGRCFDLLSTLAPPRLEHADTVVVAIDEPSFAELKLRWPWPRSVHARLVDSLRRAGAAAIVFDVLFAEPSTPAEDQALARAIRDAGTVVLAGEVSVVESPQAVQTIRTEPLALLLRSGARTGVASVLLDGDGTLRRLPPYGHSLADVVVDMLARRSGRPPPPRPGGDALLRFLGPDHTYPTVSYYQALDPGRYLPPNFLRGKVAIVALDLLDAADPRAADRFATPFTVLTGRRTSGGEVHATIIDNLRQALFVIPASRPLVVAAAAGMLLLASFLFRDWQPRQSALRLVGLELLAVGGSFLLLQFGRLWLPPSLPVLAALGPFGVEGAAGFLRERAQKRQISLAFGRYLAPALVERLLREPERLTLGGEERPMTILFCDIRGFTTLAERFQDDPQGLVRLINRFLTPMTEAILDSGGTIDKYIGDCIMAFWNAPIDDGDHAMHACAAALAMLGRLRQLNLDLAAEAAAEGREALKLDIGIGINSGPCVVGNLGSNQRFDYSVLGDAVNLASRLEGASKLYGVDVVVGESCWAATGGRFAGLELDLVAVKGKTRPTRIFTLAEDGSGREEGVWHALATAHAEMLACYRRQDWPAAAAALAACRRAGLFPRLYDLYEERLAAFQDQPPGAGWDGVHVAKSK